MANGWFIRLYPHIVRERLWDEWCQIRVEIGYGFATYASMPLMTFNSGDKKKDKEAFKEACKTMQIHNELQ